MTSRQKAWLLPAASAAVTAGVLLGRLTESLIPGLIGLLLTCYAVFFLRGRCRWIACLGVFLSAACLSASFSFHPVLPQEGDVRVTGVIGEELRSGSGTQWKTALYQVNIDGVPLSGGAYWTFYEEEPPENLIPGKQVAFNARLYHPSGQENPDGYDFRETLLQRNIVVGVFGFEDLTVSEPSSFSPAGFTAAVRWRLSRRLISLMGEEAGAYASALILGTRSLVPSEDRTAFSRLGIAHVLSVSGFHIGILIGFLAALFRLLHLRQRFRLFLYGVLLLLYSALCGMNQPVLRASLLTLLALEGKILNRPRSGLHLLSPPQITGASFQLSFGAMLGLVLVTPSLMRLWSPRRRLILALWNAFAVFLGAQFGILLPELAFFQRLPLLSVVLNLPAGLLASVLISLDWIVLLCSPVPALAGLAAAPAVLLTRILTGFIRALGTLPAITLWTCAPNVWTCLGTGVLLFAASGLVRMRLKVRLPLLSAGLAAVVLSLFPPAHTAAEYIQFSVGNADSALIWDQDRVIVLDTGEADGVLSGFLRRRRLTPDAVVLTHLHLDHAGGLASLISDGIPIRVCYLPYGAREALVDEKALALLNQLESMGTEFRTISGGDTLPLPSGDVSVLWPEEGKVRPGQEANHSSLAALITMHGVSMLQMGDLDGNYEMYAAVPANLLKIAHHGSSSSAGPDFLNIVSPQAVLLSCSGRERHLAVSERLGNIPLYSTAVSGAVTVVFHDRMFEIVPFLHPATEE